MITEKKICYDPAMETLDDLLHESMRTIQGAKAAAVVSLEGIPIASILPKGKNEIEMSALTATILSLAEMAILFMNTGELEQVCIQATDLNFVVFAADDNAVFTVFTAKETYLGFLFREGRKISEKIAKMV